jgi:hypothetical protein
MRDRWFFCDSGMLERYVAKVSVRIVALYYRVYGTGCDANKVDCNVGG